MVYKGNSHSLNWMILGYRKPPYVDRRVFSIAGKKIWIMELGKADKSWWIFWMEHGIWLTVALDQVIKNWWHRLLWLALLVHPAIFIQTIWEPQRHKPAVWDGIYMLIPQWYHPFMVIFGVLAQTTYFILVEYLKDTSGSFMQDLIANNHGQQYDVQVFLVPAPPVPSYVESPKNPFKVTTNWCD